MNIFESCLYAENLPPTRRFYCEVLRLDEVMYDEDRMAVFRVGAAMLILFKPSKTLVHDAGIPVHGTEGPGHLAFSATATEIQGWREKLGDWHVHTEDKVWPNGAQSLYFRDPAGNVLEFVETRIWD